MRVAILARPDNRSPKVLALGLQQMLNQLGIESEVIYEAPGLLMRLFSLGTSLRFPIKFHYRLRRKLAHWAQDKRLLSKLCSFDLVILSECIPNAFWKGYYDIEGLKKRVNKPVALYEVYYIGNSDKQVRDLQAGHDHDVSRFDWYLSISPTTEVTGIPSASKRWNNIGLNIAYTGLAPVEKKEFTVLIDFAQPGFEKERAEQLEVLKELNIPFIELKGQYSFEEIRSLYKKASVLMVQFPEAFGLPIAECLSTGASIMLPNEFWAMSWRLNKEQGEGYFLPDCFITYHSKEEMKEKLMTMRNGYHPVETPKSVFDTFIRHYPDFYYGNISSLDAAIKHIQKK